MSSGGKSGSNTTNEYHGTIAGALGEGPASSLCWIICGGKTVFGPTFLDKPANADFTDIDLVGVGRARFYFGTETQVADPVLTSYAEQPGYRGLVYLVLIDCSWSTSGDTSVPTIEVGWRRQTGQMVVTGAPSAIDGHATANPITVAAELLTSWNWAGLPLSRLNVPTFQSTAESFNAERIAGTNRIASSVAPLWNEQVDLKSALADLSSVSKAWIRTGVDGRIEAGRWVRGGTLDVADLTYHDVDSATFRTDDAGTLPNSFLVEFRDSTKHHKTNCVTCDNTAGLRKTGAVLRRQTASRMMLTTQEQAIAHGTDLLRDSAAPTRTVTLKVRRWKAVNPDGTPIRPGDYFTFPVEEQGDAPDIRLFRCVRREFEPTGPITLIGEMETNGALHFVPPITPETESPNVTAPVALARVVPLAFGKGVAALAARPADMALSFDVQYCATASGDYASLAPDNSFALPLVLSASVSAGASTVRVSLFDGPNGVDARRDAMLLLNWNGGAGEANADRLMLCVVRKDGGGNMIALEWMSVAGPAAAVAPDTYDVPVLRGRMGSGTQSFSAGAWAACEVWCVDSASIGDLSHPDFPTLGDSPAHFRLITFGQAGWYDPDDAWTERVRCVAEGIPLAEFAAQTSGGAFSPQLSLVMPKRTAPTAVTMVSAAAEMQDVAPVFYPKDANPSNPNAGKKQEAGKIKWGAAASYGVAFYELTVSRGPILEYIQDPTGAEPVGSPPHRTKAAECVFVASRSMAYSHTVWWVRAVYDDGTVSRWGGPAADSMTTDYGTQDMAEQRSSAIAVTGGSATGLSVVSATEVIETSSRRYKRNIRPIYRPMALIRKLQGIRFDQRKGGKRGRLGFPAEETHKVLPAMVRLDQDGRPDGVAYGPMVALCAEGLKQQDRELRQLRREIKALKRALMPRKNLKKGHDKSQTPDPSSV